MSTMTKRDLLTGLGAAFTSTALSTPTFLATTRSAQAEPVTIAIIAISVLTTVLSMQKGASGLGKIMQAVDMKLDRIMEGQIEILRAVAETSVQLDSLEKKIPNMLIEPEFRRTYRDAYDASSKTKDFLAVLKDTPKSRYGKKEFDRLSELYNLVDSAANSFVVDSTKKVEGLSGINCLLICNNTATLLSQVMHSLKAIDAALPAHLKAATWKPAYYFDQLNKKIEKAIREDLQQTFASRLLVEQLRNQETAKTAIAADPIGKFLLPVMSPGANQPKVVRQTVNLHVVNPLHTVNIDTGQTYTVPAPPRPVRFSDAPPETITKHVRKNINLHDTRFVTLSVNMVKVNEPDIYIYDKRDLTPGVIGWYVHPASRPGLEKSDFRAGQIHITPEQLANQSAHIRAIDDNTINIAVSAAEGHIKSYCEALCYGEVVKVSRSMFDGPLEQLAKLKPQAGKPAANAPQPGRN